MPIDFKGFDSYFSEYLELMLKNNEKMLLDYWLIGFTEAEGSFYLVKKDKIQVIHGIGWIQNDNLQLLTLIALRFNIKAKVKLHVKKKLGCWILQIVYPLRDLFLFLRIL